MTIPSRVLFFTAALAFAFMGCPGGGGGNTGGGTGTTGGGIGFSGGGTGSTTGGGAGSTGGGAGSTGGGAGSTGGGAGTTGGGAGTTGGGAGSTGGGAGSTGGGAGSTGGGAGSTGGGAGSTGGGAGSTGGGAGTTGGGTAVTCTEVQFTNLAVFARDTTFVGVNASVTPSLSTGGDTGYVVVQNDLTAGTYTLGTGIDSNLSTCSRCVIVDGDKTFFQESGSFVVTAADGDAGTLTASLTDVKLVEVTLDAQNASTPVPNGACVHIASLSINAAYVPPPSGWTCSESWYGDGQYCDCGCGVLDTDCANNTDINACDDCSCSNTAADGGFVMSTCDSSDTTQCTAPTFVSWSCNPSFYGDSDCDCGCGSVDIDCADPTIDACAYCGDLGSCTRDLVDAGVAPGTPAADGGVRPNSCGYINPTNNAICQ